MAKRPISSDWIINMTADNNKAFQTQLLSTAIISIMGFKIGLIQHYMIKRWGKEK